MSVDTSRPSDTTADTSHCKRTAPYTTLNSGGRLKTMFGGWSGMRRLLSRFRQPRHREAKGHRPGSTTRALPSMAGRGRGERGESPVLGEWETTPPCRRKHGPDSQKSPRWSAERRARLRQARAASPRRDAATKVRRSALRPPRFVCRGLEDEGVPGASNGPGISSASEFIYVYSMAYADTDRLHSKVRSI